MTDFRVLSLVIVSTASHGHCEYHKKSGQNQWPTESGPSREHDTLHKQNWEQTIRHKTPKELWFPAGILADPKWSKTYDLVLELERYLDPFEGRIWSKIAHRDILQDLLWADHFNGAHWINSAYGVINYSLQGTVVYYGVSGITYIRHCIYHGTKLIRSMNHRKWS